MKSERITFQNDDGLDLAARLDFPSSGAPTTFALFAHCFTCSKNIKAARHISNSLTGLGIAVLRFDFTGLGDSEGDFADTNFSSNVNDLIRAASYLSDHYQAPQILIGHSLGGAAVLQAAQQLDFVKAVATIGAPSHPEHIKHLFGSHGEMIEETGEATVELAGRPFTIKRQLLDDLEQDRFRADVPRLRKALLFLHSPIDDVVGIDNAAELFQLARHPKSFVSLDNADHLLSREEDSRYVGELIAAWARRYIVETPGDAESSDLTSTHHVTTYADRDRFRTEIQSGVHALVADEPVQVGGADAGPSPYDYLLAALGACTSITLRMYADRKEWPLEEIKVHLNHAKIHAKDCAECETETGKLDSIERLLEFEGELSEEQRQRLLEIADKCPVHRTLHSEVHITTSLQEGV